MQTRILNSWGSALMGTLVAAAMLGVMATALATLMNHYQETVRSLDQKMAIVQIQQMVLGTLANSAVCACNFDADKNPAVPVLRFDPATTTSISLPQLHMACDASGNPTDPHYRVGQAVPGTPGLEVSSLKLDGIQRVGAAGSTNYLARVLVGFDHTKMKIARNPASVAVSLQLDLTNPAQARIARCAASADGISGGGGGLAAAAIEVVTASSSGTRDVTADCPAGTKIVGCSFACTNYHAGGSRIVGNGCRAVCDLPNDRPNVDIICVKAN
jgi:hypothetical protein